MMLRMLRFRRFPRANPHAPSLAKSDIILDSAATAMMRGIEGSFADTIAPAVDLRLKTPAILGALAMKRAGEGKLLTFEIRTRRNKELAKKQFRSDSGGEGQWLFAYAASRPSQHV